MKTIKFTFKSNGDNITKTAVISDDLSTLSKSKKNEATDINDDFKTDDGIWIIFFEVSDHLGYEVQLMLDSNGNKTLKGLKAITWESEHGDLVITDEQRVKITVK